MKHTLVALAAVILCLAPVYTVALAQDAPDAPGEVVTSSETPDAGPVEAPDAGPVEAPDAGPVEAPDAGPVEAPDEPDAEEDELDPLAVLLQIVEDARSGNWRLVAAGALALLMFLLAKFRDKISWFKGDRGGAVLVMLLSLGGALSTALFSPAPLDAKLFLGAVGVAWTAVGGYTWFKKVIWPSDAEPGEGE